MNVLADRTPLAGAKMACFFAFPRALGPCVFRVIRTHINMLFRKTLSPGHHHGVQALIPVCNTASSKASAVIQARVLVHSIYMAGNVELALNTLLPDVGGASWLSPSSQYAVRFGTVGFTSTGRSLLDDRGSFC